MSTFKFKQFEVSHSDAAMKIGTDAVLTGAWARVLPSDRHIADVGCGCGIIALMLAQRTDDALITALEIDSAAASEAESNIYHSPWRDRINVVNSDFLNWNPQEHYDLIVSNPPYYNEDIHCPDMRRDMARHSGSLSPESLLKKAAGLLSHNGRLVMITPSYYEDTLQFEAISARLNVTALTYVKTSQRKQPSRILWEFSREERPCTHSVLTIRNSENQYTDQYLQLVTDFYLWL